MIKVLKRRPRSDTLVNEHRNPGGSISRWVYFALLFLFGAGILNYLLGDFFILRGDGLVLNEQTVMASTYMARVKAIEVREGQPVEEGDVLLRVESTEVLEKLAELSIRHAELSQQITEYQLRAEVAHRLLPLAMTREEYAEQTLVDVSGLSKRGLVASTQREEALSAHYTANSDRVRLAAENRVLYGQIRSLIAARDRAHAAIRNLKEHYSGGVVRAPLDGTIGSRVPQVGDVYNPGQSFLSIHSGEGYVLTYLPRHYLFSMQPGLPVVVSDGRNSDEGIVAEILPISDALPTEFQSTFKPTERKQLAKIKLANPDTFPVLNKVKVSLKYWIVPGGYSGPPVGTGPIHQADLQRPQTFGSDRPVSDKTPSEKVRPTEPVGYRHIRLARTDHARPIMRRAPY